MPHSLEPAKQGELRAEETVMRKLEFDIEQAVSLPYRSAFIRLISDPQNYRDTVSVALRCRGSRLIRGSFAKI